MAKVFDFHDIICILELFLVLHPLHPTLTPRFSFLYSLLWFLCECSRLHAIQNRWKYIRTHVIIFEYSWTFRIMLNVNLAFSIRNRISIEWSQSSLRLYIYSIEMCHLLHLTYHMLVFTNHLSHITCHIHLSDVTCHISLDTLQLSLLTYHLPDVISHVTCHMFYVTWHKPLVTYYV